MNEDIFIHKSACVDDVSSLKKGTKVWHFSHIMRGVEIGEFCNIGQNVFIAENVVVGKNVKIQNNVSLYSGLKIEDNVFIGPSAVFTNISVPRSEVNRRDSYINTIIKEGASIGANCTIICGNTIGSYSLIGAGSVVTKPIDPYTINVGNPTKKIGWISEYGEKLSFKNNLAKCNHSGILYKIENGIVNKINDEI